MPCLVCDKQKATYHSLTAMTHRWWQLFHCLFPLQLGKDFNSQQTKFSRVCSSSSSVPLCRSEGCQSRYTFQQFNLVFAILTLFQDQEDQITTDLQTCNFQKASKLHCSHFWIKSQLSQFTRASLCVFLLNRLSKW